MNTASKQWQLRKHNLRTIRPVIIISLQKKKCTSKNVKGLDVNLIFREGLADTVTLTSSASNSFFWKFKIKKLYYIQKLIENIILIISHQYWSYHCIPHFFKQYWLYWVFPNPTTKLKCQSLGRCTNILILMVKEFWKHLQNSFWRNNLCSKVTIFKRKAIDELYSKK